MRSARAVERAAAMGFAIVTGVYAFFAVPFDVGLSPPARPSTAKAAPAVTELPTRDRAPRATDEWLRRGVKATSAPSHGSPIRRPRAWLSLLPPPATVPPMLATPDALRPISPVASACAADRSLAATHPASDAVRVEEAGQLLFFLGTRRHATGDHRAAADFYEAFARTDDSPGGLPCTAAEQRAGDCATPAAALETAIALRRGLGEEDRAQALSADYVARYGETRIADAARVSLVAGDALARRGRPEDAARHLRAHTRRFARFVPLGERIRGWVARGHAERASGDREGATRSFRRALALWGDGGASRVAILPDADEAAAGAEFARTLDAVAEAGFLLAEARYERFLSQRAPRYAGAGERRDVERWIDRRLRPFVERKLDALSRADRAYRRVASLGATRHRVAADARRGAMYLELLEAFAALPDVEVHGTGEAHLAVTGDLGGALLAGPTRRLRERAEEAFGACLETAVRTRHFGPNAARCARELERLAPERHPTLLELGPSRTLLAAGAGSPRPLRAKPDAGHCEG